jgi:hypothetical protein
VKKPTKIVLGTVGAFILLIVVVAVATGGGKATPVAVKPAAKAVATPEPLTAGQQTFVAAVRAGFGVAGYTNTASDAEIASAGQQVCQLRATGTTQSDVLASLVQVQAKWALSPAKFATAAETDMCPGAVPPAPKVFTYTGHGNESTPKFTTSGDFTVSWAYSGNVDVAFGQSLPDNFSVSMFSSGQTEVGQTGQDLNFNDPNEIQASDSGNQTISGDDGTHYFTVQSNAASAWTFKITTSS